MEQVRVGWFVILTLAAAAAGCGSVGGLIGVPPGSSEGPSPAVASVQPPADALAPPDAPISITFTKPMRHGTLEIAAEPPLAFGEPQWSEDARTVTVRPASPLLPGVIYTVRVRGRDRLGNPMAEDFVWSFSAGAPREGRLRIAERLEVGMDARLFTFFVARLAAGETGGAEPNPLRSAVRARLAELPARVVDPVRRFFADHPASADEYLAAVLALSAPPEFREAAPLPAFQGASGPPGQSGGTERSPPPRQQPGSRPATRPQASPAPAGSPALQASSPALSGLGPLLAQFYAGANIAELWRSAGTAYAEALENQRKEAPVILGQAADYLRGPARPVSRLVVLPNLLGRPGEGYLVQQSERVIFVVAASPAPDRLALIRPFVRLVLGPIRGTAGDAVARAEPVYAPVREIAAARSGLRTWPEVVAESLFEAAAIRLALSGEEAQAALRAGYDRGLILVHHFTAQLADYERSTVPLAAYYPTMMAAVDNDLELRRWAEHRRN